MRIGFVPVLKRSIGGGYQYSITMLQTLDDLKSEGCEDEFIMFASEIYHTTAIPLNGCKRDINPLYLLSLKQKLTNLAKCFFSKVHIYDPLVKIRNRVVYAQGQFDPDIIRHRADIDIIRHRADMKNWLLHHGIQLMLYSINTKYSFEAGIPYIMPIHDLQHRLNPQFPEVSANGEWEKREYLFRNGSRYAIFVLVDSEVGKEDVLNFYGEYGVTPDQVRVLPFLPANYLSVDVAESDKQRIRANYNLPEQYLFYPAQFWSHKNHIKIIQALELIKQSHNLRIPIVFCGSYAGVIRKQIYREVMTLVNKYGLTKQVHYLGYVPDEDMSAIYAGSLALVMPTFFGPTNIPVLEAWAFGCPVLTSDIRGIREQVGDAAVLVDPNSVESIADGIYRLYNNEKLRNILAERGKQRLSTYTPDDFHQRLSEILKEAKERVRLL
ncbi:glycosyltransferase family 4 protein [Candidatus Poribacteria bacterium]|nr:glycosyltransferase family 4 protein [Candidatus Poribacteria bacterium]